MSTAGIRALFGDESTESIVARAHAHIGDLCSGPSVKWRMSIPPTARDSDILLTEALERLAAEVDRLREALRSVASNAEWWAGRGRDTEPSLWLDGLLEVMSSARAHALAPQEPGQ